MNDALSKVFLFTLDAGSATPTVVYLASVDQARIRHASHLGAMQRVELSSHIV